MNFHAPTHDQASERERWNAIHAAFLASLSPEWRKPIFVINSLSDFERQRRVEVAGQPRIGVGDRKGG